MRTTTGGYLTELQTALQRLDTSQLEAVVDGLFQVFLRGGNVYTFGNGASAALASHMACDLGKGTATDVGHGISLAARRLRVISLADNVALMTAYGNDLDYRDIYLEQLKNLLGPGDAVIGISGSGSSPNVLRGMEYARSSGALTIGFTGGRLSGDQLARHCDICVRVPLTMMEQIEDLHVVCHHAVGLALRERIFEHARTEFVAEALTLPEVGIPDQIQA